MTRIVVLGVTGFTGRLVAEALVRRGARPVLVARDRVRLDALSAELGNNLDTHTADLTEAGAVKSLLRAGDVVITTVGPFSRFGDAVAQAAIRAGAHYLDSSGEPSFNRRVFEVFGPQAEAAKIAMLTAFATEWVLGCVAGGAALESAGSEATRVDTGYFLETEQSGRSIHPFSLARVFGGTSLASGVTLLAEPGFTWRDGRLVDERFGRRLRKFDIDRRRLRGLSIGGSEHFDLPRKFPHLCEVNVYLGWFGSASGALRGAAMVASRLLWSAPARRVAQNLVARASGSRGGPAAARRADVRSLTTGIAYDRAGHELSRAILKGPELYELTAELLAWGAVRIAESGPPRCGALGPIEAFGLPALGDFCSSAGLTLDVRERLPLRA